MEEAPRERIAALWMRLLGFALVPVTVQAFWPTAGAALGMLTPLPLAYGVARRNALEGFGAIALVSLATSLALGPEAGLYFMVETAPLCLATAWAARSNRPLYLPVLGTVALVVLLVTVAAGLYGKAMGMGPAETYRSLITRLGLFADQVPVGTELPADAQAQLAWFIETWKRLFFGIWVATLILLVTFYTLLVRGWLAAARILEPGTQPGVATWRVPFPFVGLFIILAAGVLLGSGLARDAALNALVPLGTLYGIQGVAVTGHLLSRWAVPAIVRMLILLFIAIWLPTAVMLAIALVGLFDTWFDFRRRFPLRDSAPPV